MPTIELKRIWCKTCQEFELHKQQYPNWEDWFCKKCETAYTSIKLKEIPKEKILEQRKRYSEYKNKQAEKLIAGMISGNYGNTYSENLFSEVGSNIRVQESDAGQRKLDERRAKKEEEKSEERRIRREEKKVEIAKYKRLGRNDKCICGSGLKYKNCCLLRIRSYE